MVEDNKADVLLVREALESAGLTVQLHVVSDGDRAVAFIENTDADALTAVPLLVLLDLSLPRKSGIEVLNHLRQSRRCSNARVIVITSSDSEIDRSAVAQLEADAYFRKPSDYDQFMRLGVLARQTLERAME